MVVIKFINPRVRRFKVSLLHIFEVIGKHFVKRSVHWAFVCAQLGINMRNLRWDCEQGENCYIEQILPNWAVFNECFAGTRIRITDVDGVVERNGKFLFIEVKQNTKTILTGQKILFEKLTENAPHISVLLLYAHNVSKEMDIQEYAVFKNGEMTQDWTPTNTEEMKGYVKAWFQRAHNL